MKPEQTIERYLSRKLKEVGGMAVKLVGYNGIPDRLAVFPDGSVAFIELKAPGGRLAPIQTAVQFRLRNMGQDVRVLWSIEAVDELIKEKIGC